ncbi:MAG: hypothetical protein ACRENS_06085 [Candidatus Eiseniibacteriota bacterium]
MKRQTSSSFALLARAAIEKQFAAARGTKVQWRTAPGHVWASWPRPDGKIEAVGARRHLDWLTGEAALMRVDRDPDTLPGWTGDDVPPGAREGYRVRLGDLLGDGDRWWPAGERPEELAAQLEWILIQLSVKLEAHFARHPLPE